MAKKRVKVAFEFIEKLGAPYYCFHDRDVAPEGKNLKETNANFDAVVKVSDLSIPGDVTLLTDSDEVVAKARTARETFLHGLLDAETTTSQPTSQAG